MPDGCILCYAVMHQNCISTRSVPIYGSVDLWVFASSCSHAHCAEMTPRAYTTAAWPRPTQPSLIFVPLMGRICGSAASATGGLGQHEASIIPLMAVRNNNTVEVHSRRYPASLKGNCDLWTPYILRLDSLLLTQHTISSTILGHIFHG
jgi:hypothetical protein